MKRPTIYIHHDAIPTGGNHLSLVNVQHKSKGYPRSTLGFWVFYQYFIERDGALIQCRPEMDPSVVFKKAHENSIPVCLAGDLNSTLYRPAQQATLLKLFKSFRLTHGTTALDIKEHRDYQATSCPGASYKRGHYAYMFLGAELSRIRTILYGLLLKLQGMRK